MTNLELLNYALSGIQHCTDILNQYEDPSIDRDIAIQKLKSNRKSIEEQIEIIRSDASKIVPIMQ